MANSSDRFGPSEEEILDILDEEFNIYIAVAKDLMSTVQCPHERNVCVKYIRQCCAFQTPSLSVKINRNAFFKYFLKILRKASVSTEVKLYSNILIS